MTDFLLLEHLNRMILGIPKPRLMFKKGICLEGFFRPYMSFSDYTQAEIFESINKITHVVARFSSMLGDWGTADTARNIKGLAVKFIGSDGEYDLITQNIPAYFINEPRKIPELYAAFTVRNGFDKINSRRFWEFITANPESINCAIRLFSYKGISDSFINEQWYSVNTYIWENQNGERFLVRCKWEPVAEDEGISNENSPIINRALAEFMAGFDPDKAIDGLQEAIEEGIIPGFELQVQIVNYKYISHPNYLKQTLCWNEAINNTVSVGIMKLTKIKDNAGEDDVFFASGNTISGIELCNDEFSMVMNHAHKMNALGRGGKV